MQNHPRPREFTPPTGAPLFTLQKASIQSGGRHGPSASMVSPAFATVVMLASGVIFSQAAQAIDYSAMGATATDTAWVIISASAASPLGNFVRVGTSAYFVNVVATTEPVLPADSAWLMRVTLSGGAITAVADRRTPLSVALHGRIDITDALFGADPLGTSNASPAMQAAIDLHREMQWPLYVPTAPVGYRVDTPLNLTNLTGQLLITGDGSLTPSFGRALVPMQDGSILLGNTGAGQPVFDCLGSNNTVFRDLNICSLGQTTPSQFGCVFGTSTTAAALEAPGGSNNSLENVSIQLALTTPDACPVYYVGGAGLSHYLNVWTLGVHGFRFTASNDFAFTSLYATPGVVIGVDGIHMQGCNLLGSGTAEVLYIEHSHNMRIDQLYVATIQGGPSYAGQPYPIVINNAVDIKLDVECDYFPSVLLTLGTVVGLHIKGSTFPNLTPIPAGVPLIAFFQGTAVRHSSFQVEPVMGPTTQYHYATNGLAPTMTGFASSSFTFHRGVSTNIAFFNVIAALGKPFFNLRFDGTDDGGTYSFLINGVAAGATTMRYWTNGVLVGTG